MLKRNTAKLEFLNAGRADRMRLCGSRNWTVAAVVPLMLAFSVSLRGSDAPVRWMWSGALTESSATVKAGLEGAFQELELLLSEDPQMALAATYPPAGVSESGVAEFRITGLAPDTRYFYAVEVDEVESQKGSFETFPEGPASFSIALGSCAATGSNHAIFDTIRELEPIFFLHMGDFHYEDIAVSSPAAFRRAFEKSLTAPRQAALYRSAPIVYVWDDHDFGPDDADGTSPSKPAALGVYQEYVPHYPLQIDPASQRATSIQQAFSLGRIRFIVTDLRAERSPVTLQDGPAKTMLGLAQRDWFFAQLESAARDYPLVVWVNTVPWITKSEAGSDRGWEAYGHERRLIADRIKALGLNRRLLVLSGDAHMVALDDGTNSDYSTDGRSGERAFPVFQAAPLDRFARIKGGPYSHGAHARKKFFGLGQIQQFGQVRFEDDGHRVRVELRGFNWKGELLEGMELDLECDGRACRASD